MRGCINLGHMYYDGRGVPRNTTTARQYYQKACKGGYQKACQYAR